MSDKYLKIANWKRIRVPNDLFPKIDNYKVRKRDKKWYWNFSDEINSYIENSTEAKSYDIDKDEIINISYKAQEITKDIRMFKVKENVNAVINIDIESEKDMSRVFTKYHFYVEKNATLTVNRIQRLSNKSYIMTELNGNVESKGVLNINDFHLGSKYNVVTTEVHLESNDANTFMYPIYIGNYDAGLDLSYTAYHKDRFTNAIIHSNGLLKRGSNKVFRGNLYFKKGSSRSIGREQEYCVLFDEDIKADSIPALMCDEDNVIGEHAASIGKFNEDKLFYLMSRGLDESSAKLLVAKSIFQSTLDRLEDENLYNIVEEEIKRRLNEL